MLFPRIENIQLSFFAAVAAAFEASNKKDKYYNNKKVPGVFRLLFGGCGYVGSMRMMM